MVRGPVIAHQASTVYGKDYRQILQGNVVDNLVVAALEEGGVYRHYGAQARRGQPRCVGDSVLLSHAHIEAARGEKLPEVAQTSAVNHRRRDRHNPLVLFGQLTERLAEYLTETGLGAVGDGFPVFRQERGSAMESAGIALGGLVTAALLGQHVQQHRALKPSGMSQQAGQVSYVVAVNWAEVSKAEFLKQHPRHDKLLDALFNSIHGVEHALAHRHAPQDPHGIVARPLGGRVQAGTQLRQIRGHRPDIAADTHLVIIEHYQQIPLLLARLVKRLQGQSAGQRPVTDDCHYLLIPAAQVARGGKAQGCRNRGAAVTGPERVVRALLPAGEARKTRVLAQTRELFLTAREQLVSVALVPHVPDDLVGGRVERAVQRNSEFHRPQVGRQVPTGARRRLNDALADFRSQTVQVA